MRNWMFGMSLLLSSISSLNIYAQPVCKAPQLGEVEEREGSIFRFTVKTSCMFKDIDNINTAALMQGTLKETEDNATEVLSKEELPGEIRLKVLNNTTQREGTLTSINKVIIKKSGDTKFNYWFVTDEIKEATDNMRYTRRVYEAVQLESLNPGARYLFQQTIDIEKPGFAPRGIFIRSAKSGVLKGFKEAQERYLKITTDHM